MSAKMSDDAAKRFSKAIDDLLRAGNGVDVKDDSSRLRRGVIRSLADRGGLIVDFLYPGHHAEFVPFKEVISGSIDKKSNPKSLKYNNVGELLKHLRAGEPAETLFQRSPNEPWCWYPSTLLAPDLLFTYRDGYAFVEMDCGDQLVREVVPPIVMRGWTHWTGEQKFQIPEDFFNADHVVLHPDLVTAKTLKQVELPDSNGLPLKRGAKRTASGDDTASKKKRHTSTKDGFMSLPLDVVCEVLSLLPVQNQMRYRLVCHAWNNLIPWVQCSLVHMSVRCSAGYVHVPERSPAWQVATVIHQLVAVTKCLVFRVEGFNNEQLEVAVTMLKAKGIKVPILIVLGGGYYMPGFSEEQKQICGRLFYGKTLVSGSK